MAVDLGRRVCVVLVGARSLVRDDRRRVCLESDCMFFLFVYVIWRDFSTYASIIMNLRWPMMEV